jgi:delta 1-pyrroline-5-carboxylate dehydrogenase
MGFAPFDGVGVTTSETAYMRPPIEPGREGGTVVSVVRLTPGTGQTAGTKATTDDNINGVGCTLTTTVTGGAVDSQTVAAGGDGYRVGDVLSITGTTSATFRVVTVSYTN